MNKYRYMVAGACQSRLLLGDSTTGKLPCTSLQITPILELYPALCYTALCHLLHGTRIAAA
jgi:hypothetical protein